MREFVIETNILKSEKQIPDEKIINICADIEDQLSGLIRMKKKLLCKILV